MKRIMEETIAKGGMVHVTRTGIVDVQGIVVPAGRKEMRAALDEFTCQNGPSALRLDFPIIPVPGYVSRIELKIYGSSLPGIWGAMQALQSVTLEFACVKDFYSTMRCLSRQTHVHKTLLALDVALTSTEELFPDVLSDLVLFGQLASFSFAARKMGSVETENLFRYITACPTLSNVALSLGSLHESVNPFITFRQRMIAFGKTFYRLSLTFSHIEDADVLSELFPCSSFCYEFQLEFTNYFKKVDAAELLPTDASAFLLSLESNIFDQAEIGWGLRSGWIKSLEEKHLVALPTDALAYAVRRKYVQKFMDANRAQHVRFCLAALFSALHRAKVSEFQRCNFFEALCGPVQLFWGLAVLRRVPSAFPSCIPPIRSLKRCHSK